VDGESGGISEVSRGSGGGRARTDGGGVKPEGEIALHVDLDILVLYASTLYIHRCISDLTSNLSTLNLEARA